MSVQTLKPPTTKIALSVVLCGSFRRDPDGLADVHARLAATFSLLSPRAVDLASPEWGSSGLGRTATQRRLPTRREPGREAPHYLQRASGPGLWCARERSREPDSSRTAALSRRT